MKDTKTAVCVRYGRCCGIHWAEGFVITLDGYDTVTDVRPSKDWTERELRRDAVMLHEWKPRIGAIPPFEVRNGIREWRP